MKVRNLKGSHSLTCVCDSWLQHWENNSGKKAENCSVLNCSQKAEVGGHVQKRGVSDNNWYIIPICTGCNNKHGQEYEVKEDTGFISVNETSQCGQQLINEALIKAGKYTR